MALDGIVLSCIVNELNTLLIGGRVIKVAQPEKDELIISIRNNQTVYKLLLTSGSSYPRIHITSLQKNNPLAAPSYCMILRKYLNNAKITRICQPNFERIVEIYFEHLNELGDLCEKTLIIEIMGRHSNIILRDERDIVLDSIKHVTNQISSVREVYPGKEYIYPPGKDKKLITNVPDIKAFISIISKPTTIKHAIYDSFTGLSPLIADEMCLASDLDPDSPADSLTHEAYLRLYTYFNIVNTKICTKDFRPNIILDEKNSYLDYYVLHLSIFNRNEKEDFSSISQLLDSYYEKSANISRVNQKSSDIRKIIQNNIERCSKKLELQLRQIDDTKDLEKYKIKGELIHSNLYQIHEGDKLASVYNYYTNEMETIVLDPNLTPNQNAQKFYQKYNKKKRTFTALTEQIETTKKELDHLESIRYSLEVAGNDEDLTQIRAELVSSGYIKFRKRKDKKANLKSEPIHYISSDGFDIYIGKNNYQNDELSLKFANSNDWWFHTKEIPGSHVIVKTDGRELTDKAFEEAASLAAYYSKAKDSPKVSVDYTLKKNLKKPNGSVPGYVIYHTNFSMIVTPEVPDTVQEA